MTQLASSDCHQLWKQITHWRLPLEECGPTFSHVKGKDNVVADALSRLDKHSMLRDGDVEVQGNFVALL